MDRITIEQFGKDHWSLLMYIQTRVLDCNGILDVNHLRSKNTIFRQGWTPEYGTRLFGYWNKDSTVNRLLLLGNHDDFNCLEDLEGEGLVKNSGTRLNPVCTITEKGIKIICQLLLHKQAGNNYSDFVAKIE